MEEKHYFYRSMDMEFQKRVKKVQNIISIYVGNEQRLTDALKLLFIRC